MNQNVIKLIILVVVVGVLLVIAEQASHKSAASTPSPSPSSPVVMVSTASDHHSTAMIVTDKGTIQIEFYNADAPLAVTNFVRLAQENYYNGLTFHRVEPGFVIQGGDPNGNGTGGHSIWGTPFRDELNPNTQSYKNGYKRGVVAMANSGPNTNGSQFFIMLADNSSLPHDYTIFGVVTSGMDVVDKIAKGDVMRQVTVEE